MPRARDRAIRLRSRIGGGLTVAVPGISERGAGFYDGAGNRDFKADGAHLSVRVPLPS